MNGYFNNLAIRTVNRGNLVQPRTASVFESQGVMESTVESGARSLATDYRNETGSVTSDPFKNSVPGTSPSVIHPPENIVATEASFESGVSHEPLPPSGSERTPQPSEPETRVTQTIPVTRTRVLSASPAPVPVNEVLVHEEATTVELPQPATAAVATTATKKTIVQQPRSSEPETGESFPAAQTERSVSPLIKNIIHETETTRSAHHFTERLTQHTKQTTQIKQTNQITTRREQLLLESPTDAEPSINVTIGRVEVRATPTPSAKQKTTRTASPVMPLEEYLRKQRRGDER